MPFDIQPFDEDANTSSSNDNHRSNTFMDDLRARVADGDEKQRQKWEKAAKPAVKSKPLTPARPDWLTPPKQQQAAPKGKTATDSNPIGRPKRKSVKSNSIDED